MAEGGSSCQRAWNAPGGLNVAGKKEAGAERRGVHVQGNES